MRSILVTGGAGFIGSQVVDALIKQGERVIVIDDLSNGTEKNLNIQAKFIKANLVGFDLDKLFKEFDFKAVFHLAAQINIRQALENPQQDAEINIMGSLNLIKTCLEHGQPKIIFSSSGGALYPYAQTIPQTETVLPQPLSPYGVTKLAIENYLQAFAASHGLNSVSLRYANVYGPRQQFIGDAAVVAVFISRLLKNEPIIIFGDGTQTRDFINVKDVVTANLMALADTTLGAQVFHISSQTEITINELLLTIQQILGIEFKPNYGSARPGEIIRSCLNYAKARDSLGWQPQIDLKAGLGETIDYFKQML